MAQRALAMKMGRSSLLQRGAFQATRSQELTNSWVRRLGATAQGPQAREMHSQMSSILDFYNLPQTQQNVKEIDWAAHKAVIHTPNVVDKIQAKYDAFMATEYQVDAAVAKCGGQTEKMQALDVAMKYNFALYLVHYMSHIDQIELMRNIGDMSEMSQLELMKYSPGIDTQMSMQLELGDMSPDSYTEESVATRVCTQYSWGTRWSPPFNHSQDTVSAVVSTLGKLGK